MLVPERLLDRMQRSVFGETFDRGDLAPVRLDREDAARFHRLSVDQNRARPALTGVAGDVRSGESGDFAQVMHEQKARLNLVLPLPSVDGQRHRLRHRNPPGRQDKRRRSHAGIRSGEGSSAFWSNLKWRKCGLAETASGIASTMFTPEKALRCGQSPSTSWSNLRFSRTLFHSKESRGCATRASETGRSGRRVGLVWMPRVARDQCERVRESRPDGIEALGDGIRTAGK